LWYIADIFMAYAPNTINGTGYSKSDRGSNSGGGFGNYTDDYSGDRRRREDSAQNNSNQIAAAQLAVNDQSSRFKDQAQFSNNLAERSRDADLNRSLTANNQTLGFKREESEKDREQRKQEFADNQFMQRTQIAQGRADLEYSTQQGQRNNRAQEQAAQILRDAELANATGLANISQQTQFGEQKSSIERASLQAKAQVQAALFGSKPGYVGY
jgi:hypothetical protein